MTAVWLSYGEASGFDLATLESWFTAGMEWEFPEARERICVILHEIVSERIEAFPIVRMAVNSIVSAFRKDHLPEAMSLLAEGIAIYGPSFYTDLTIDEVAKPLADYLDSELAFRAEALLPRFVLLCNYVEVFEPPLEGLIGHFWRIGC
jgi:hypothetical protein